MLRIVHIIHCEQRIYQRPAVFKIWKNCLDSQKRLRMTNDYTGFIFIWCLTVTLATRWKNQRPPKHDERYHGDSGVDRNFLWGWGGIYIHYFLDKQPGSSLAPEKITLFECNINYFFHFKTFNLQKKWSSCFLGRL